MPGAVRWSDANCSALGYGKGFRSTPSRTLKTTVLAPTAAARVTRVMTANIGARVSLRKTCRSWLVRELMSLRLAPLKGQTTGIHCSYDGKEREVPGKSGLEDGER